MSMKCRKGAIGWYYIIGLVIGILVLMAVIYLIIISQEGSISIIDKIGSMF